MIICCAIVNTFCTSQYNTSPLGNSLKIQPKISGIIRKMRRWKYLNATTCAITDSASIAKIPPIRTSSTSAFSMIAKAPSAPPRANEPVSPMITSAGNALYQRNPIVAPISAPPRIARSRCGMLATPKAGCWLRMKVKTLITVKVKTAMIPAPAASPSMPSARLTPCAAPAMTKKTKAATKK